MSRLRFAFLVGSASTLLLLGSCSGGTKNGGLNVDAGVSPCFSTPPDPTCGQTCSTDNDCGAGFYCGTDGKCAADCGAAGGCPSTHQCDTARGKCVAVSGPCASSNPFPGCGTPCNSDNNCPFSFDQPTFCAGSICTAECVPATHDGCAANQYCDNGRCKVGARPVDAGPGDAGMCPDVNITATPVVPTVILIVDQSGSMNAHFPSTCNTCPARWNVARDVLINSSTGIVTQFQTIVRFGIALYTAHNNGTNTAGNANCPEVIGVDSTGGNGYNPPPPIIPALNDRDAIATVFLPNDWQDDTPTGDSITKVTTWLQGLSQVTNVGGKLSWQGEPIIYVLATDGEPDSCENGDPSGSGPHDANFAKQEAVDAVTAAHNLGIDTYVIRVAANSTHFDDLANAGGTGPSAIPADDPTALADALHNIVKSQISCDITLNGSIQDLGTVCTDGTVQIQTGGSTTTLNCKGTCDSNQPGEWCAVDSSHVRILGTACDTLQSGQQVTLLGRFKCGSFFVGG